MTEAEQYHQWRYLEPEDTIIVGNAKRFGDATWKPLVAVMQPDIKMSEAEGNATQDAYLESKGIDCKPRKK